LAVDNDGESNGGNMRNPENLAIYSQGLEFSVEVIRFIDSLDLRISLKRQLERSSASIADNIAEGCGFNSDKKLRHHCRIAMGSLLECQTQLHRVFALHDVPPRVEDDLSGRVRALRAMLEAFVRYLDDKLDS
jgi:four helix bundle protein